MYQALVQVCISAHRSRWECAEPACKQTDSSLKEVHQANLWNKLVASAEYFSGHAISKRLRSGTGPILESSRRTGTPIFHGSQRIGPGNPGERSGHFLTGIPIILARP